MLPLQFRHPGPPFPTRLCPAGHPRNGLKFWLVGWLVGQLVGHGEVTWNVMLPLQFHHPACPSRPFYALQATPKTALNFGWLVGRLVGRLVTGSHTNVTLPFQFRHPGPPFPTLLRPADHPKKGLKFWLVGRLVGRSREVT
jgi:hypothetical protein